MQLINTVICRFFRVFGLCFLSLLMGQQAYANESQLKAQLIAGRFTHLAAGISSLVTAVKVKDGELVESGAPLILFDCDGLKAAKAIAKAHIDAANAQFNSLSKLHKLNSASALEVTLAATEQATAKGELDSVAAKIKYCAINAPYQSRVVARHIQPYQYVEPGTELLHIYDPSSLEVQFVAPSSLLSQLSGNKAFSIHLDELGIDLTGNIIRTGGQIDPVSQTIKVYGKLNSHPAELLEGMSGFVTLQP